MYNETVLQNTSILFVSHMGIGSNALSLYKGFESLVTRISYIDTSFFDTPPRFSIRRVAHRFTPQVYAEIASRCISFKIRMRLRKYDAKILFVYKGNWVRSDILESSNFLTAHLHPDDSTQKINRTRIFDRSERHYDIHFTTREINVLEIQLRTKKPVIKIRFAYDPDWHFRRTPSELGNTRFLLGFIGHYREDRAELISTVSKMYKKNFCLVGKKWERFDELKRDSVLFPAAFGPSFSEIVAEAPLQLGLLNSENRDEHTARSFEVPASGGLLLAEDTPEHRDIFKSESNALFFKTTAQLLNQIDWVIANPAGAREIANAGYELITNGSNSWADRANEILTCILDKSNSIYESKRF
jgi:hypothetical protein